MGRPFGPAWPLVTRKRRTGEAGRRGEEREAGRRGRRREKQEGGGRREKQEGGEAVARGQLFL